MKSKAKKDLEKEFKRMGVRPRIFHFADMYPFRAITVATDNSEHTWSGIKKYIEDDTRESGIVSEFNRATHLLEKLRNSYGLYGVAICDRSDNFSRQGGRNKAKGRLLQHLLKQEKQNDNKM